MRRAVVTTAFAAASAILPACSVIMPGDSYRGQLPLITAQQQSLSGQLRADVQTLAGRIGPRNTSHPAALAAAEDFLAASLARTGYLPRWQTYLARHVPCSNIEVVIPGVTLPDEIVLLGAHYDSYMDCPGANDNASGAAAALALARLFAGRPHDRTIRIVFFTNEEPPHFWTDRMGSLVYARAAKQRGDRITAMLSLETMGCYSDEPGSQDYPPPFSLMYPSEGNFIAFVGMQESRELIARCVGAFRAGTDSPCEGRPLGSAGRFDGPATSLAAVAQRLALTPAALLDLADARPSATFCSAWSPWRNSAADSSPPRW